MFCLVALRAGVKWQHGFKVTDCGICAGNALKLNVVLHRCSHSDHNECN